MDSIFSHAPKLADITRSVYLILHSIASSCQRDDLIKAHISLLALVVQRSRDVLSPDEFSILKDILFVQPGVLKDIMMAPSSPDVLTGNIDLHKNFSDD